MDLRKFVYKETLEANYTQKTLYLLGTIKGNQNKQQQQQQAIIIITPKLPSIQPANYNNINNINQQQQQKQQQQYHQHPIFPFTNIQTIFQNDIYSKYEVKFQSIYEIQSIYPITQKHKSKYKKKLKYIQKQTKEIYQNKRQSLLIKELMHIDWVKNIIDGKAEQQRVLYEDQSIILLPDFKFHNLQEVQNLHLLCIFKDLNLHSIRDLTQANLPLLQNLQSILQQQLKKHFTPNNNTNTNSKEYQPIGIQNCRVYFHYPPTFYQLHLHIQSLQLDTKTSNTQRCHMLLNVIQNIKIKANYYQSVTLNCFKEEVVNNNGKNI